VNRIVFSRIKEETIDIKQIFAIGIIILEVSKYLIVGIWSIAFKLAIKPKELSFYDEAVYIKKVSDG